MERFVIIVNGFQPLNIITKRTILDVAAVLDPPLKLRHHSLGEVWQRIYELLIKHFLGDKSGICELDQLSHFLFPMKILGVLQSLI